MRPRALLLLLAAMVALAGCASKPAQNDVSASTPPPTTSTVVSATPATPAGNDSGGAAFLLMGPELRFAGNNTTSTAFHEDDAVVARYVLSLTPGASSDATALAAFLVNGKVVDIQTVHLRPGESKEFLPPVSLSNLTALQVQVKVGAAEGHTNATILRWPRMAQSFALGAASVTLISWTNDSSGLHAQLSIWTPADGNVTAASAALLCPDAKGVPQPTGQQPVPLTPGQAAQDPLDFPTCAAPYGLAVSATDADGTHEARILFSR